MKLYLYDHCPFCVRAEMVAHYKQVPVEQVYLLNDDEASCFALIGAKQVPILQFDDGRAMGESLDIARKLDEIGNPARAIRPHGDYLPIQEHMNQVRLAVWCLLFPRDIALDLPEFATAAARDYFRAKKEQIIQRSFAQALAQTAEHKAAVEAMLASLPALPLPSEHGDSLGWDDVLLYPGLRNLSMVEGLAFPPAVRAYVDEVARLTATATYFDRAI
ncbi:glutaredoxin 2 [Pseudomonas stutzeri]|nr:glutaredoxin 2 [Stutzerimonas stutzeri]